MEFDHIGGRCELASCNIHDYLSYKCNACGKTFCQDHRTYEGHQCPQGLYRREQQKTFECPFCGRPFVARKNEKIDQIIGDHIDRGCPKQRREFKKCSVNGCRTRDPVCVTCKACALNFCLEHRLETDHACRAKKTIATQNKTQQVFGNSRSEPLGRSDLDHSQRFQLEIHFPIGALAELSTRDHAESMNRAPLYMFFSRRSTVGKVVDEIYSLAKVRGPASSTRPVVYCVRPTGSVFQLPLMQQISELVEQHNMAEHDKIILEEPNADPMELFERTRSERFRAKKDQAAARSPSRQPSHGGDGWLNGFRRVFRWG